MVLQGDDDGFGTTGGEKFGENVADMEFYSRAADHERLGDLVVVQALDHQVEDFAFTLGKVVTNLRYVVMRC